MIATDENSIRLILENTPAEIYIHDNNFHPNRLLQDTTAHYIHG